MRKSRLMVAGSDRRRRRLRGSHDERSAAARAPGLAPGSKTGAPGAAPLRSERAKSSIARVANLPAGILSARRRRRAVKQVFNTTCATCHQRDRSSARSSSRTGATAASATSTRSCASTMPVDNPGGLKDQEYLDVIAYLLKANHAPATTDSLSTDTTIDARHARSAFSSVITPRSLDDHATTSLRSRRCFSSRSRRLASHDRRRAGRRACRRTNDLPNPYRTVDGWAKMPEGRTWGSTSAVDIDKDGKSIWVAERCGDEQLRRRRRSIRCSSSTRTATLVAHFGAGTDHLAARHPRRQGRQHLGHRLRVHGRRRSRGGGAAAHAAATAPAAARHRRDRRRAIRSSSSAPTASC